MSIKYFAPWRIVKATNAIITALTPPEGDLYYDTTNHLFMYYNGTAWKSITGLT